MPMNSWFVLSLSETISAVPILTMICDWRAFSVKSFIDSAATFSKFLVISLIYMYVAVCEDSTLKPQKKYCKICQQWWGALICSKPQWSAVLILLRYSLFVLNCTLLKPSLQTCARVGLVRQRVFIVLAVPDSINRTFSLVTRSLIPYTQKVFISINFCHFR